MGGWLAQRPFRPGRQFSQRRPALAQLHRRQVPRPLQRQQSGITVIALMNYYYYTCLRYSVKYSGYSCVTSNFISVTHMAFEVA